MNLTIGMKVQWTHVSTMSMTLREGTIKQLNEVDALVQTPAGRTVLVELRRLQPVGAPSQLGEFVEAMREAHTRTPAE